MKKTLLFPLFLLLLTSCNEEQVLYTEESEEPIPPVDTVEQVSPHGAMGSGPMTAGLPTPMIVDFDLEDPDRSTVAQEIEGVRFPFPEGYDQGDPSSGMRAAEFTVPNAEGEPGELIVYYFGPDQGGGVMANAERWAGQFTAPEGEETPILGFFQDPDVNGLRVSRLMLSGTWSGGMSGPMMQSSGSLEGYGMDALIVEGGANGSLFVRLTGPIDLVERQDEAMRFLASNVEPSEPVAAPAAVEPAPAGDPGELALVEAPGVQFAIPGNWREEKPQSSMRALQFAIPSESGSGDAEFILFYFGPQGGGTIEQNFERWARQVQQPDGSSSMDAATVEQTDINGLSVSSIYVEGTYAATSMGPMAPAPDPIEGQGFMGIIISEGSEGPLYIRINGPAETMKEIRDDLGIMLGTLKPTESE